MRSTGTGLADAPFVGAIYTPDEEVGDCHAFCQQLAARLKASGVASFAWAGGHRHSPRHGAVSAIDLGDEVLPVDQLVIAAGHRSPLLALPGLQLPLYPLKGYSLTVPIGMTPGAGREHHRLRPQDRLRAHRRTVAGGGDGRHRRFRPGGRSQAAGADQAPGPRTFPDAGDYDAAVEWAGMRPATPTGVPLLGATAYRNLWLNLGHGALGFTLACGSGQLLSELIGSSAIH
jgi:D-amino-acid dehydrogenase